MAGKMEKACADRFKPDSPDLTINILRVPEEKPDRAPAFCVAGTNSSQAHLVENDNGKRTQPWLLSEMLKVCVQRAQC